MPPLQFHKAYSIAICDEIISIIAYGKDKEGSPILVDWKFGKEEIIYSHFDDGEWIVECHGCLMDHRFTLPMMTVRT